MQDIIFEKFQEQSRWEYAIQKGVTKGIDQKELRRLSDPVFRTALFTAMLTGNYRVAPPYTAKIPKNEIDPETKQMKYREVVVNKPVDRIVFSIINDLLFELTPHYIHPSCKSYQKGIGCGKVVTELAHRVAVGNGQTVGWKSDLSKYFDRVPIRYIDAAFDRLEAEFGHSCVIDVVREYYHSDLIFDSELGEFVEQYKSLKQGCAVASWLADVILYDLDARLSALDGSYYRYSDDQVFIGPDYLPAMDVLVSELGKMEMEINRKKREWLDSEHWFKFLGFSIKGRSISLSESRIKSFQREVESRTVSRRGITYEQALSSIYRFLYKGNGEHSWATQVLPVINVREDILCLNEFVMDCLRAVQTGRHAIGGLGYVRAQSVGCISRGRGRNVTANRQKHPTLPGYHPISFFQRSIVMGTSVYAPLVSAL